MWPEPLAKDFGGSLIGELFVLCFTLLQLFGLPLVEAQEQCLELANVGLLLPGHFQQGLAQVLVLGHAGHLLVLVDGVQFTNDRSSEDLFADILWVDFFQVDRQLREHSIRE